jgi:hypothetical protein
VVLSCEVVAAVGFGLVWVCGWVVVETKGRCFPCGFCAIQTTTFSCVASHYSTENCVRQSPTMSPAAVSSEFELCRKQPRNHATTRCPLPPTTTRLLRLVGCFNE